MAETRVEPRNKDDTCKAIVQTVIINGKHGPFFVALCDQLQGSVTCSLDPTVWKSPDHPEEGEIVLLSKLRKKRAGWRAKAGRFFEPSDEQQASQQSHQNPETSNQ